MLHRGPVTARCRAPILSMMSEPDRPRDSAEALFAPAEAAPLSRRERAAVIARIEALMEYWGITPEDLADASTLCAAPPAAPEPSAVKYRHPVSGETWDGTGPHPDWLRKALLQEGYRVDELRPSPAEPAA